MATIIEYTDAKAPRNTYPARIVSPSHSGPCCVTHMEDVGPVTRSARWEYQYRRCRRCGYTVRAILREVPDAGLLAELRQSLETAFQRNVPDL